MIIKKFIQMATAQYKITVKFNESIDIITVAGFSTNEESEQLICKHLYNVCKQSNGSFEHTQSLLTTVVHEWQNYFTLNALQLLQYATHVHTKKISNISLYRVQEFAQEKLINSIHL